MVGADMVIGGGEGVGSGERWHCVAVGALHARLLVSRVYGGRVGGSYSVEGSVGWRPL